MKAANPKLWAAIGAVVGAFLMPSTWILLIAVSVGGQLMSAWTAANPDPLSIDLGPNGEIISEEPAQDTPTPWWLIAGLIVAAVVTVLSSVFFGWMGARLARTRNQQLEATGGVPAEARSSA